jgi:DNA-binding MarR family transcriptional regulator
MSNPKLLLGNQLCFPLYATSKEIIRKYRPFLEQLGITYTQYITLLVLWEEDNVSIKELGERLYLDSGTLTPIIKKLEKQGIVTRERDPKDERKIVITLTSKGHELYEKAQFIPDEIRKCVNITDEEFRVLYNLLYKVLDTL